MSGSVYCYHTPASADFVFSSFYPAPHPHPHYSELDSTRFSPHHVEVQYSKMGFCLAQGEVLPSPTPVQIPLLFNPLLCLRQMMTCGLPFRASYYLGEVKRVSVWAGIFEVLLGGREMYNLTPRSLALPSCPLAQPGSRKILLHVKREPLLCTALAFISSQWGWEAVAECSTSLQPVSGCCTDPGS